MSEASTSVVLLGAGGHARVLLDALGSHHNIRVVGLIAPGLPGGHQVFGFAVLGDDDYLERAFCPGSIELANGLGCTGDTTPRSELFKRFSAAGYRFLTIIHEAAIVSVRANVDEGGQVMAGAVVQAGSRIGRNSIVNTGSVVDHDCEIGDHVHVAPGVTLSGGVRIGDGAHIGTGASIIHGVTIGAGAVVGAGSVVVRDVPANARVIGIPAKQR